MAIACPIPELPPVTRATLSCSPFTVSSSWGSRDVGENPRPAVAEEGGRVSCGADLTDGADGPERGVPERWFTWRRAVVRSHIQIRVRYLGVARRGAIVDRACGDAQVEVLGPEHGSSRLVARDFRGEPAQRLLTELIPVREHAGRGRIDGQRLVEVERCRGPVHPGRGPGSDAGELRRRPEGGQCRPAAALCAAHDQFGALYGEEPAVFPERRGTEPTRGGHQGDLTGFRVQRCGEDVLGNLVQASAGCSQPGRRAAGAASGNSHGVVSPSPPRRYEWAAPLPRCGFSPG